MARVIHVEEKLKDGESEERLIRRFFKKCKKQNIVKEYLEKTSFFKTKRQKKKEKSENAEYLRKSNKNKVR